MHYSTISGVSDNEKLALFLVLLLNFYVKIFDYPAKPLIYKHIRRFPH